MAYVNASATDATRRPQALDQTHLANAYRMAFDTWSRARDAIYGGQALPCTQHDPSHGAAAALACTCRCVPRTSEESRAVSVSGKLFRESSTSVAPRRIMARGTARAFTFAVAVTTVVNTALPEGATMFVMHGGVVCAEMSAAARASTHEKPTCLCHLDVARRALAMKLAPTQRSRVCQPPELVRALARRHRRHAIPCTRVVGEVFYGKRVQQRAQFSFGDRLQAAHGDLWYLDHEHAVLGACLCQRFRLLLQARVRSRGSCGSRRVPLPEQRAIEHDGVAHDPLVSSHAVALKQHPQRHQRHHVRRALAMGGEVSCSDALKRSS